MNIECTYFMAKYKSFKECCGIYSTASSLNMWQLQSISGHEPYRIQQYQMLSFTGTSGSHHIWPPATQYSKPLEPSPPIHQCNEVDIMWEGMHHTTVLGELLLHNQWLMCQGNVMQKHSPWLLHFRMLQSASGRWANTSLLTAALSGINSWCMMLCKSRGFQYSFPLQRILPELHNYQWQWWFPHGGLSLTLEIMQQTPGFVTCDNLPEKVLSTEVMSSPLILTWWSSCSWISIFGTMCLLAHYTFSDPQWGWCGNYQPKFCLLSICHCHLIMIIVNILHSFHTVIVFWCCRLSTVWVII